MTWWLGLTGAIGSGKSAVAERFVSLGVSLIDADVIAHQLTAPDGEAIFAIRQYWGGVLFSVDGSLNRQKLRDLVFRQPEAKQQLEAILHPLIYRHICQAQQAQSHAASYGVVDIPLLTEKPHFQQLVNRVLMVDADEKLRLHRVQARSGLDENSVRAIMAQQASRDERLAIADEVIENNSDWRHLDQEVARLHRFYQTLNLT